MPKPVICIGASLVDELFHLEGDLLIGTTNESRVTKTPGGVSRNIAHQLALLDVPVQLIGVFGNDGDGDWLKQVCRNAGIQLDASITRDGFTGKYTGILNGDGSLFTAFLSQAANYLITPAHFEKHKDLLQTASYILADANISAAAIGWLLEFSRDKGIPFIIEPVSVPPAMKLKNIPLAGLHLVTPNEDELPVLCNGNANTTEEQVAELLQRGVEKIWLHTGSKGSSLYAREYSLTLPATQVNVVDCTGAGDGSLAGFILGKFLGRDELDCLKLAHTLAAEILQVHGAIATELNRRQLLELVNKYYPG